jgi:hypothetical protein
MEHFCFIVVFSCCSFCVVLSVSSYGQFHVHCINLGLTKCENMCVCARARACVRERERERDSLQSLHHEINMTPPRRP